MPMCIYYSESIEYYKSHFNSELNLISIPFNSSTYSHSTIYPKSVHGIFHSLLYAFQLLNADSENNKDKAINIIFTVLSYQDLNKSRKSYGAWPYFHEEPIENEVTPNLSEAGLIVTLLHQIMILHKDILNDKLRLHIKQACISACLFIIQNCILPLEPVNTLSNIYATIITGQLYNIYEYVKYGENTLNNLYNSILFQHQHVSFNTSISDTSSLNLLELIIKDVNNENSKMLAHILKNTIWKYISEYYHPITGQISGPQYRNDGYFLYESIRDFFLFSIKGKQYTYSDSKEFLIISKIPEKYLPHFTENIYISTVENLVHTGHAFPSFKYAVTSTTHMNDSYTIGSFNREEFAVERKPILGYFGNCDSLYCIVVECIHNGHQFASAALHSIQYKGFIMGDITFTTNRGDTKLSFENNNGIFTTKELLIRLKIIGNIEDLKVSHYKNTISVEYNDTHIFYNTANTVFADNKISYHLTESKDYLNYDTILYSGKETLIDMREIKEAFCSFALLLTNSKRELPEIEYSKTKDLIISEATVENNKLSLETPVRPGFFHDIFVRDRQMINGTTIESHVSTSNYRNNHYEALINTENKFVPFPNVQKDDFGMYITEEISKINISNPTEVKEVLKTIFKKLETEKYTLDLIKRFSLNIAISILEITKRNYQHLKNLNTEMFLNTFQKILLSANDEKIYTSLLKFTDEISFLINTHENDFENKKLTDRIISLMHTNLLNPNLSIILISDTLKISPSYISRTFHKATGMTFREYLIKIKLSYAKEELIKGTSITEISNRLGYSHPNSFMRIFKNNVGITISQFLKTNSQNIL